jgi:hypothetical protein
MLSRFKQVLSVVTPSTPQNRGRLKDAIAARDKAQQGVAEYRETVERLATVIRTSDDAARLASDATQRAAEARREWVRNGCRHSEYRELQALDDAAAQASRAAESAGRDADVINKTRTLAHAQGVLQSAQTEVRYREEEISTAIGSIIADEAAPLLERFEHVAEEYRTLRAQVMAVQRVLDPDIYGNHGAKSADGARFVRASLGRATIRSWDQERDAADAHDFVEGERGRDAALFEGLTASHRARAAQLRNDPDA